MHDAKYRCNSVFFILLSQAINFTVQRRILPLFSLQFRNTNYATRLPHITKYATHNKRMLRHFYPTPIALKQENSNYLKKKYLSFIHLGTHVFRKVVPISKMCLIFPLDSPGTSPGGTFTCHSSTLS